MQGKGWLNKICINLGKAAVAVKISFNLRVYQSVVKQSF